MPFVLLILGIVFLTVSIRDTENYFVALLRQDFIGPGNFLYWVAAILIVGAIGYIEAFRKASDALIVLVLVSLFLSKGGFFDQFFKAIQTTDTGGGAQTTIGTVSGSVTLPVPIQLPLPPVSS